MDLQTELGEAAGIARDAGGLLLSYFGSDRVEAREKGLRDVVTAADVAAENLVLKRLRSAFPRDGIVAEEGGHADSASGRWWYVDPLDGTFNYSRGVPIWCVSLSLVADGQPIVGVIHDPIRGETFSAAAGRGARCNGHRMQCSDVSRLSDACVHVTIDFNEHSLLEGIEDVAAVAPRVLRTRNTGSAALALAYVAAGRFDAMLHRYAHTWDYAGGVALIREAGGAVSDMAGNAFTEKTKCIVATANTGLGRQLLELVQRRASSQIE
jgi:myo-inositol-1(or 4)-monophosphatase